MNPTWFVLVRKESSDELAEGLRYPVEDRFGVPITIYLTKEQAEAARKGNPSNFRIVEVRPV